MGKALYRQYRSTSFDEVIGQEHITTTLKNSLKSGTIAHAYLLTGPRGVGKTSVARILAYSVNDIPYEKDGNHLDIIEIDAASNRRIDEIRSLRERVNIAPASAKYKVYIIDEVHMLTREAFNALLKTLEEPPAHVIFILATTEVHKLPDTIVSRCITFTFRPIENEAIADHLAMIAKKEGLKVSKEALDLLAIHGEGSFRDSISLLDQIKNIKNTEIERSDIELALGLAPSDLITQIIDSVVNGDPGQLNKALSQAYLHGASETNLAKQLAEHIRSKLLANRHVISPGDSVELLKALLAVPASIKPRASLELSLLTQLFKSENVPQYEPENKPKKISNATVTAKPAAVQELTEPLKDEEEIASIPSRPFPIEDISLEVSVPANNINEELWDSILQKLKGQNNTLYGIARMAHADLTDEKLTLAFKFPFHFKQVNQAKNKSILSSILSQLGHEKVMLDITLTTNSPSPKPKAKKPDEALSNITNIFGDSEVLES